MDPEDLIDLDDLDWQEDWENWITEIEDDEWWNQFDLDYIDEEDYI